MDHRILFAVLLSTLTACAEDPPALEIGDVAFSEVELLGLNDTRRRRLAELTAFGLATAREEHATALTSMLERARDVALVRQAAADRLLSDQRIDDEQLSAHYLTNPGVELTVRHVLFFSERWRPETHRREAHDKAEAALRRLRSGDPFPEVAAELSEEPGAEGRQGLLQPGREGAWVSEFWNAALTLEVGDISPVVETEYGFHVLRLEGRDVVPFEEARPEVVLAVAGLIGSIEDASRNVTRDEARTSGVVLPTAVSAAIMREWEDRLFRWSTALGFAPGLTPSQVKEVARAALGSTAQLATIARNELEEVGPELLTAYPMTPDTLR